MGKQQNLYYAGNHSTEKKPAPTSRATAVPNHVGGAPISCHTVAHCPSLCCCRRGCGCAPLHFCTLCCWCSRSTSTTDWKANHSGMGSPAGRHTGAQAGATHVKQAQHAHSRACQCAEAWAWRISSCMPLGNKSPCCRPSHHTGALHRAPRSQPCRASIAPAEGAFANSAHLTAAQHLPELGAAELLYVQPLLLRNVGGDVAAAVRQSSYMCVRARARVRTFVCVCACACAAPVHVMCPPCNGKEAWRGAQRQKHEAAHQLRWPHLPATRRPCFACAAPPQFCIPPPVNPAPLPTAALPQSFCTLCHPPPTHPPTHPPTPSPR